MKGDEMTYFIVANTFAAPIFSNTLTAYQHGASPQASLAQFVDTHPNIYAANVYKNADQYHQNKKPLAIFRSAKSKRDYETNDEETP